MTARRARGAALLAAAATLAFTSGCSGDATAGSQASLEKPNLKVAVVPALDSAGFFVALYDGLFAGKGLHVTFSPATSSDKVISAQVRGPNFPVERYVVTKQWAQKYPRTLAAFDEALEQGQQIADCDRAAVEQAMEDLPAKPVPLAVSKQIAAVMALDHYPFTTGGAETVDKVQLQRVVVVMRQFLDFSSAFNINSMLTGG